MGVGIFLSYRRQDSSAYAGRLFDWLAKAFGADRVFMDIDTLGPGDDFLKEINRRLSDCGAVLALIGPQWTTLVDQDSGVRRLDNPEDFVRRELAQALAREVWVIPLLVGGARMPKADGLPNDLKSLSKLHAFELTDTHFHKDVDQLIDVLRRRLSGPRFDWRKKLAAAAIAAAVLVAGAFAVKTYFGGVDVPGVVGKPVAEARQALAASGITTVTEKPAEDERAAPGTVVAQRPAAGERLSRGDAVDLTVATVPRVEVPNLVGELFDRARALLAARGLVIGPPASSPSADRPPGTILSQTPAAGTRAAKGEGVSVVVAVKPPVTLPDLRGQALAQARAALSAAGLAPGKVEYQQTGASAPGTVLEQRPSPGEQVAEGSAVELVVAASPDVAAPNLAAMTLTQARAVLAKAGLTVGEIKTAGLYPATGSGEPVVRSQTPAAGTQLKSGSKVNLTVAEAGVRVPALAGMVSAQAKSALEDSGLRLGNVQEKPDPNAKFGVVIDQRVPAGTVVAKGAPVDITVAARSAAPLVAMPNLVGTRYKDAAQQLRSMGFREARGAAVRDATGTKIGAVLSQVPPAGAQVSLSAPVTLQYAVAIRYFVAPGRISSGAEADPHAKQECAGTCSKEGGRWTGRFGYRDTVSCECELE